MTPKDAMRTTWRVAFPTIAIAWLLVLFGGVFFWGRANVDDYPGWWWAFVVSLAPIGFYVWRRKRN